MRIEKLIASAFLLIVISIIVVLCVQGQNFSGLVISIVVGVSVLVKLMSYLWRKNHGNEKYLILLDNSFKSHCYCYSKKEEGLLPSHFLKWDEVIGRIEKLCPDFTENDYRPIDTPLSNLEFIGNKVCENGDSEEWQRKLEDCFPQGEVFNAEFFRLKREDPFEGSKLIEFLNKEIPNTYANLEKFFQNELDIAFIIKQAKNKLNNFLVYPNVSHIKIVVEKWISDLEEGKEGAAFRRLVQELAWDKLIRHQWNAEGDVDYCVTKLLLNFYISQKKDNQNFPGAVLFAKFFNQNLFKETELLDPNLTEYACMGYFDEELVCLKPVIVISCDFKKQNERINQQINGVLRVNKLLGRQALPFYPGYLICLHPKDPAKDKIYDVRKMILEVKQK